MRKLLLLLLAASLLLSLCACQHADYTSTDNSSPSTTITSATTSATTSASKEETTSTQLVTTTKKATSTKNSERSSSTTATSAGHTKEQISTTQKTTTTNPAIIGDRYYSSPNKKFSIILPSEWKSQFAVTGEMGTNLGYETLTVVAPYYESRYGYTALWPIILTAVPNEGAAGFEPNSNLGYKIKQVCKNEQYTVFVSMFSNFPVPDLHLKQFLSLNI